MGISFIEDEPVNQHGTGAADEFAKGWGDSDYESDPVILTHDLQSERARVGEIEDDSDTKGVSRQADTSMPGNLQKVPDAGRQVGDVTSCEKLNRALLDESWSPFSSEHDFNLACWFFQSKVHHQKSNLRPADATRVRTDFVRRMRPVCPDHPPDVFPHPMRLVPPNTLIPPLMHPAPLLRIPSVPTLPSSFPSCTALV